MKTQKEKATRFKVMRLLDVNGNDRLTMNELTSLLGLADFDPSTTTARQHEHEQTTTHHFDNPLPTTHHFDERPYTADRRPIASPSPAAADSPHSMRNGRADSTHSVRDGYRRSAASSARVRLSPVAQTQRYTATTAIDIEPSWDSRRRASGDSTPPSDAVPPPSRPALARTPPNESMQRVLIDPIVNLVLDQLVAQMDAHGETKLQFLQRLDKSRSGVISPGNTLVTILVIIQKCRCTYIVAYLLLYYITSREVWCTLFVMN